MFLEPSFVLVNIYLYYNCGVFCDPFPHVGFQGGTLLLLLLFIRVLPTSVSWGSFTGHWVTASLRKSLGLFSVFWPFSIMLLFGWSPLSRQLPNPTGPLISLYLPCQKHKSQLIQLSLSCSIVFSILLQGRGTYPSIHILSVLFCGQPGQQIGNFANFLFFFLLIIMCLVFWPWLSDQLLCQSPIGVYVCHFLG